MPSLEGKAAVVTGASSGIGAATAQALAAEGARVVGGARRSERIAAPVTALELDVTDPTSCDRFVTAAAEELSGIDNLVNIGSVAGRQAYEKGSLYVTSKFAVRGFTYALREDLLGRPVHITTVDPGLVQTDFSLVRFRGDEDQAGKVYEGVEAMKPEDIAECIVFAVTRPPHVNIDELVVKALAQSSGGRILRTET